MNFDRCFSHYSTFICSFCRCFSRRNAARESFENFEESTETSSSKDAQFSAGVSQNGTPPRPGMGVSEDSQSTRKCSHKNLAMQGGKDWFRVESKSFKILVEVVKGKGWKNAISRWQGSPLGSFERREKELQVGALQQLKKAWVNPSSSVVDGPLGDKFSDVVCGLMVPNKGKSFAEVGNVLLVWLGGMPVLFEFELSSYGEGSPKRDEFVVVRVPIKTNGSMVLRMLHVVIKNREDSSKRDEGFKGKPLFLDRWSSKVGCFSKGVHAREACVKDVACDKGFVVLCDLVMGWGSSPPSLVRLKAIGGFRRLDSRENTMEGTLEGNHNSVGEPLKMNYLHRCSMEFLNNVVKSSRGFEEVAREELALK
ncbi:hypothetical protein AAG906_039456 [Vitis piasezkii]